MELKNQIEAILFSAGKKVSYEELSTLCNAPIPEIKKRLYELKKEYEDRQSSLLLIEEADGWKLTVKEKYLPIVQKLIPETELPKSILETLAVIAWKHPAIQSEVIKIRTNKAYDHIRDLEKLGFITKEKKGRSYLIKLTNKFNEYFDIPNKEKLKDIFKDVKDVSEAQQKLNGFERKEQEIKENKEETGEEKKETKKFLDKLEIYDIEEENKEVKDEKKEENEEVREEEKVEESIVEETEEETEKKEEKEEKEKEKEERKLSPELEEIAKEEED